MRSAMSADEAVARPLTIRPREQARLCLAARPRAGGLAGACSVVPFGGERGAPAAGFAVASSPPVAMTSMSRPGRRTTSDRRSAWPTCRPSRRPSRGRRPIDGPRAADPPRPVTFRDLWDHPDDWRGRRVTVRGTVARVFRQGAVGSFPPLVEAWLSTPEGDLFCVVFPRPRAGTGDRAARAGADGRLHRHVPEDDSLCRGRPAAAGPTRRGRSAAGPRRRGARRGIGRGGLAVDRGQPGPGFTADRCRWPTRGRRPAGPWVSSWGWGPRRCWPGSISEGRPRGDRLRGKSGAAGRPRGGPAPMPRRNSSPRSRTDDTSPSRPEAETDPRDDGDPLGAAASPPGRDAADRSPLAGEVGARPRDPDPGGVVHGPERGAPAGFRGPRGAAGRDRAGRQPGGRG